MPEKNRLVLIVWYWGILKVFCEAVVSITKTILTNCLSLRNSMEYLLCVVACMFSRINREGVDKNLPNFA